MTEIAEDVNVERSLLTRSIGTTREATAGKGIVPVIDMSEPPPRVAQRMWDAASTVGFFTVVNHGIPEQSVRDAFDSSSGFFSLEQEAKHAASPFAAHLNSGYEFMSQVRPSTGTADQKESLQITARAGSMDGRWPAEPPSLQPAARTLLDASHGLACRILDLLEPLACPSLTPGTLSGSHHLWGSDGQCTLRMLHYPPTAPPEPVAPGAPQLWRAGPHTDWCCVTLLYQLPGNEGLECAANPRVNEHKGWLTVDPVEGGIAVNIGDMLSRWSDGRLLSNLHRVRMPTAAECSPPKSRHSIAFFMQADKAALIAPEQSEPITAGDYILGRIRSNFEANFALKEKQKETAHQTDEGDEKGGAPSAAQQAEAAAKKQKV